MTGESPGHFEIVADFRKTPLEYVRDLCYIICD